MTRSLWLPAIFAASAGLAASAGSAAAEHPSYIKCVGDAYFNGAQTPSAHSERLYQIDGQTWRTWNAGMASWGDDRCADGSCSFSQQGYRWENEGQSEILNRQSGDWTMLYAKGDMKVALFGKCVATKPPKAEAPAPKF